MRKHLITALVLALAATPALSLAQSKKGGDKKKKYDKTVVTIEAAAPVDEPKVVALVDPAEQLYGEWTLIELGGKDVYTEERPYLYLDFQGGNKLYGNNGCNAINGTFSQKGNSISFDNMITTMKACTSTTSERSVMRALSEVRSLELTALYSLNYLKLKNSSGKTIMRFRRQNLDFLNGAWMVKEMGGANVSDKNVKLVIDIQMLTVHALTKCNVINGVVTIDPRKDIDVQFEDLKSSHNMCEDIDTETMLLICLEEAVSCKRINDNEMALLDNKGAIVMMLQHISLRK